MSPPGTKSSPSLPDAKPPLTLSAMADRAWHRVTEAALNTGWTPVACLAEAAVVAYVAPLHAVCAY